MNEAKGVEAVERALKILNCFGSDTGDLGLADLARMTGEHKSTILRMIVSLERFGYLVRGETGRYRLGATVWRLGVVYRDSFDISEIVRPELQQLSACTNETASYYIREGENRICILRSEPTRAIRHSLTIGSRMALPQGASGRVLLAWSDDTGPESQQVREDGYAVSLGERDPEVAAISVPLLTGMGKMIGALAISGLITRFDPERRAELLGYLRQSQRRLSDRIVSTSTV